MRKSQQVEYCALGYFALLTYPFIQVSAFLFDRKGYRYSKLDSWLNKAIRKGQDEKATTLALEYLELAKRFRDWNSGNAIHDSHQALGIVSLRQGDIEKAKEHLILAGRTHGSPQLNSFGPQMLLARELLVQGEKEIVLKYLGLVGRFWANEKKETDPDFKENKRRHKALLEQWKAEIRKGKIPHHRMWS